MELVKEFGDSRALLLEEDHIVLKLETPWPQDVPVPEGLSLANENGLLLVSRQGFVTLAAKNAMPLGVKIAKALFCDCVSFESSDIYASAATKLLKDAEEICILHNMDNVYNLILMFLNIKVLALPHDLRTHALEEARAVRPSPLAKRSQLRELLGTTDGESIGTQSIGGLYLKRDVLLAILRTCPEIRRLESPCVFECFTGPHGLDTSTRLARTQGFTHLMLFSVNYASGGLPSGAHAREIALAAEYFPFIETFQVVVGSLEALEKVEAFRHLRSLSVSLATNIDLCDVDSVLRRLLTRLPGLETLRLERCSGLRLSAIAKLCPNLKYLRLVGCAGSTDDVPLNVGAFPNLEALEMSMVHRKVSFIALFLAIRNTLRTARFCHDDMCVEFLHYCAEQGERLPFQCLEELTLETGRSLPALELEPGNLHDVLKALPALRHLETDSYDLRLFFEKYCVPPGRVSLSWLTCVYCTVHKPADPRLERIKKISKAMMSSKGKAGNSTMS